MREREFLGWIISSYCKRMIFCHTSTGYLYNLVQHWQLKGKIIRIPFPGAYLKSSDSVKCCEKINGHAYGPQNMNPKQEASLESFYTFELVAYLGPFSNWSKSSNFIILKWKKFPQNYRNTAWNFSRNRISQTILADDI